MSHLAKMRQGSPSNDLHRLAYADWLEEHGGRPERAEFIRLQLRRAKLPEDSVEAVELGKQEATLRGSFGREWHPALPEEVIGTIYFTRGFPHEISIRWCSLEGLVKLLREPAHWTYLRELSFSTLLEDDHLAAIAAEPNLEGLSSLALRYTGIGDRGGRCTRKSSPPTRALVADTRRERYQRERAALLMKFPHLANLRALSLEGNQIGYAGAGRIS